MGIDLKTRFRALYRAGTAVGEVTVPPMRYLAIDGHGDPNTAPAYALAVEALYTCAYATRAELRSRTGEAWTVGPLEGLWSADDPAAFTAGDKGSWDWTMLIALPDELSADDLATGLRVAAVKKPGHPIDRVTVRTLDEGRCLQILHVGSYDDEAPTLATLHHEVMPARGLTWNGRHHEIYLGDPRRVEPARLKTVLRQPVAPL